MTAPGEEQEREAKRLLEVIEQPGSDARERTWKLGPVGTGMACVVAATMLLAIPLLLAWLTWHFVFSR